MEIGYIWNRILKKARGKVLRNSSIHKTSKVESGSVLISTKMNKYSYCGYDCKIINCSIGSFCSIADNVIIGGATHPMNWVSTSPVFFNGRDSIKKKFSSFDRDKNKETIIGNDVWIGDNVMIKAGIKIGDGAVIGMGSVVTHDVLPYEVVAGAPSKHIRFRFDTDTITRLLDSKWWELDDDSLAKLAAYIQNPESFLNNLK